jgi:flagellar protein FlbT
MAGLVLELRPGEAMIINGALIRFRTRSRIELVAKARFLFGKQIMSPEQADSPARRIYFQLQSAYVGEPKERLAGLASAHELIVAFKEATTSLLARDILDRAEAAAREDNCYLALKLVRRIINHEDMVLGRSLAVAETCVPSGGPIGTPHGSARVPLGTPPGPTRSPERISEAHA